MGATGWLETEEWQGDIESTLHAAQERVRLSDEFMSFFPSPDMLADFADMLDLIPQIPDEAKAEFQDAVGRLDDDGRPATATDARNLMAESLGTSTILDAHGIRPEPRTLTEPAPWGSDGLFLSQIPANERIEFFGTAKPSLQEVLDNTEPLFAMFRGDSRYIVIESEQPTMVAFVGISGD